MCPLNLKQDTTASGNTSQSLSARAGGGKELSKPVRYVVPGLYITPFGDRRSGCLKARA